jgi:hypothetical protein
MRVVTRYKMDLSQEEIATQYDNGNLSLTQVHAALPSPKRRMAKRVTIPAMSRLRLYFGRGCRTERAGRRPA